MSLQGPGDIFIELGQLGCIHPKCPARSAQRDHGARGSDPSVMHFLAAFGAGAASRQQELLRFFQGFVTLHPVLAAGDQHCLL
jgi:hypothetical protein